MTDEELVEIEHRWLSQHGAPDVWNGYTDVRRLLDEVKRLRLAKRTGSKFCAGRIL